MNSRVLRSHSKNPPKKLCTSCRVEKLTTLLTHCSTPDCPRMYCFGVDGCLQRYNNDQLFYCAPCCITADHEFLDKLPAWDPNGRPTEVHLCIWYLRSMKNKASILQLTLQGGLQALGMTVHSRLQCLQDMYDSAFFYEYLVDLKDYGHLSPNALIIICILTEGTLNSEGGLWVDEAVENQNWHMPFHEFFQNCLALSAPEVHAIMRQFKRRTVVPVACGVGLREQTLQQFSLWLSETRVLDEVILPSNMSILASVLQGFLLALVTALYINGQDIESSLIRAWLGDENCRHHTALILMRPEQDIEMFMWTPQTRPLGVVLPRTIKYCRCNRGWRFQGAFGLGTPKVRSDFKCRNCAQRIVCRVEWDHPYTRVPIYGTSYIRFRWTDMPKRITIGGEEFHEISTIAGVGEYGAGVVPAQALVSEGENSPSQT